MTACAKCSIRAFVTLLLLLATCHGVSSDVADVAAIPIESPLQAPLQAPWNAPASAPSRHRHPHAPPTQITSHTFKRPATLLLASIFGSMSALFSPLFYLLIVTNVSAGLMSGLTMGLMSLDSLNLEVLLKSGTTRQKAYAGRILPLVNRHHLLLVTLLLSNAAAMETLPIFLNKLVPEWIAIIVSVTLVLFFGEVIPQAVCTRYGLAIGANLFWLVWGLIIITFPVSWPISKILDAIIGSSHTHLFRRNELKALVSLHQLKAKDIQRPTASAGQSPHKDSEFVEGLSEDEVKIIKGALEMKEKKVADAYCELDDVFMLDFNTTLDKKLINTILKAGHSRIPIYRKSRHHVIGVLPIKTILKKAAGSSDPVSISKLELRAVPSVSSDKPLFEMLHLFRTGRSHLAIVLDASDSVTCIGIITLEDVVEELIQMEIWDEEDVEKAETSKTPAKKAIDINRYYNEKTPLIEQYGFSV